jgi:periplasmic protein TonB
MIQFLWAQSDSVITYTFIDEMPRYSGCEELPTISEKSRCAHEKMLDFINSNLIYPANQSKLEGTVFISFIVEKDGSLTNFLIKREMAPGFGEEAIRVFKLMPKWIPAKRKGVPLRIIWNIGVKFK